MTADLTSPENCIHNKRCRYTNGFYCEECQTFFGIATPTYRCDELLSSIWIVLSNINANRIRAGLPEIEVVRTMMDKIGIGIRHENYEELITEAEFLMRRYGKNAQSATIVLGED